MSPRRPASVVFGLSFAVARSLFQCTQHRQVSLACRGNKLGVRQVGNCDKANMRVLAVESTPGQRLVGILKPMGANEIRVVDDWTKVTGVGRPAFVLAAGAD